MIKNYSTYIKESIDEEEINFIPFKLREEIDPEFIWNEESEKISYGRNDNTLDENDDYFNEMERILVGKNVNFYTFNYRNKEIKKCHGVIDRMIFNSRGILVLFFDNKNNALDERKPITTYTGNRKYSEVDPFGEEDWGDD